jgi:hypothetical protein
MVFVDASGLVKLLGQRHSVSVRRLLTAGSVAISRLSEVRFADKGVMRTMRQCIDGPALAVVR